MRSLLFCMVYLLLTNLVVGQKQDDFQKNFYIAKQHLSQRKILKALPYLLYLQNHYPQNKNLQYLIGVCYAEAEIVHPNAISFLEYASDAAALAYDPNSLYETGVPIYVYYYLCIAYAQSNQCEKASKARDQFLAVYPHKDPFYIRESLEWVTKCEEGVLAMKQSDLPVFPDFQPYQSKEKEQVEEVETSSELEVDTTFPIQLEKKEKKVVTKHLEYSTDQPLFGVQLGAFNEVIPVSRFRDLKNVDAFMDKNGLIRYVIGHFSINSQAESLLRLLKEKGYEDAFIVNVNNEKKFAEEVISIDDINIKANLNGKIIYSVQIGAFKESISKKTANMYFEIEGIKELRENEYTYLTVGKFRSYNEAKLLENEIRKKQIKDAFVIATINGKKISLQQANEYNN